MPVSIMESAGETLRCSSASHPQLSEFSGADVEFSYFLSHVVVVEDCDSGCCRNGTTAGDPLEDYTMHSGVR